MKTYHPRKGSNYYMINSRIEVRKALHTGSAKSNARIRSGNAFRTFEEAERLRDAVVGFIFSTPIEEPDFRPKKRSLWRRFWFGK